MEYAETGRHDRRPKVLLLLVAGAVAALLVAGAIAALALNGSEKPAGVDDEWSAVAALCPYGSRLELDLGRSGGEVIAAGPADEARRLLKDCSEVSEDGHVGSELKFIGNVSYFVVNTGMDRCSVRLVAVQVGDPASLTVVHRRSGDACPPTAVYRGRLVLAVKGPSGSPTPEVDLRHAD